MRGIHWWPVNSAHNVPVTWKMFTCDDVTLSQLDHERYFKISTVQLSHTYVAIIHPSSRPQTQTSWTPSLFSQPLGMIVMNNCNNKQPINISKQSSWNVHCRLLHLAVGLVYQAATRDNNNSHLLGLQPLHPWTGSTAKCCHFGRK